MNQNGFRIAREPRSSGMTTGQLVDVILANASIHFDVSGNGFWIAAQRGLVRNDDLAVDVILANARIHFDLAMDSGSRAQLARSSGMTS